MDIKIIDEREEQKFQVGDIFKSRYDDFYVLARRVFDGEPGMQLVSLQGKSTMFSKKGEEIFDIITYHVRNNGMVHYSKEKWNLELTQK